MHRAFLPLRRSHGVNNYVTIPGQAGEVTRPEILESASKLHAIHTESERKVSGE